MKVIVVIIVFLAGCFPVAAQTITSLADNPDDGCRIKLEKIRSEIDARHKKYEFNAREYSEGLFCSECGRTKSEIEERAHISFDQHIRDGITHNRRALIATQKMYDDLYVEYLADFNRMKRTYEDKYNDCGGDGSAVLQILTDEQWQAYAQKLSGYMDVIKPGLDIFGMEYNFYYAWTLKINITRWKVISTQAIRLTRSAYQNKMINYRENMVEKAAGLFNNYLRIQGWEQQQTFPGPGMQPTWPFEGGLTINK